MKPISVSHTLYTIHKVKNEMMKILKIIDIISFISFFIYYCCLILSNINNTIYLITYIVLFSTLIASVITEKIFNYRKIKDRKEKRIKYEINKKIKFIIKVFKYIAKLITIIVAITALSNKEYLTISTLFTLVSALILILQLILEVIINFGCKYIDYFRFAIELDIEDSPALLVILRKEAQATNLEKKEFALEGKAFYTEQESKIIDELKRETKKYKDESQKLLKERIKQSKAKIRKLTKKQKMKKVEEKFQIMVEQAKTIAKSTTELDELIKKAEILRDKLPKELEVFKYIPTFISLIKYYMQKKYTKITPEFLFSTIGIIIYLVAPIDVLPDNIPLIGYLDEAYLITKCLENFENELTKFTSWRDSQEN